MFTTAADLVLVRLRDGWSGPALRDYVVAEHGVYIRECGNKLGVTSQYVRLVVRPADDVARLIAGLHAYTWLVAARPMA